MVKLSNIRSLTDFLRNSKTHIRRLERSGQPEVLTVNGQARVVIQDADSYQKLLDAADLSQSAAILHRRLLAADAGKPGIPADQVLAKIRAKLRL